MNTPALLTVALAVAASVQCVGAPHPLDACNLVWFTPSTNASGSNRIPSARAGWNV